MRLTVLGSNGTYPTPGRPASGYLIDGSLMLDCGPGAFTALLERVDPADLSAVVLSHGHGDHCLDLFPLFNYLRYGSQREQPLPVFVPPGLTAKLTAFVGAGPGHDFLRLLAFDEVEPGDERRLGEWSLRFGAAAHPVPALVTRVDSGAASLTYSGDTGPGGDLESLGDRCSLLLCEATYTGPRPEDGYPYHLHASEAGAAARRARAGRLLVTHVAPTLDPAVAVAEAAAEFDGSVAWAAPGLEVEL